MTDTLIAHADQGVPDPQAEQAVGRHVHEAWVEVLGELVHGLRRTEQLLAPGARRVVLSLQAIGDHTQEGAHRPPPVRIRQARTGAPPLPVQLMELLRAADVRRARGLPSVRRMGTTSSP